MYFVSVCVHYDLRGVFSYLVTSYIIGCHCAILQEGESEVKQARGENLGGLQCKRSGQKLDLISTVH